MQAIQSDDATLLSVDINRRSSTPLHRQICRGIRDAILDERIGPGSRLPSTRAFALELGVSRNSVLLAFDQLRAEGYLSGSAGGGTRVRHVFPEGHLKRKPDAASGSGRPQPSRHRHRHNEVTTSSDTPYVRPPVRMFAPGVPAIDAFPIDLWRRLSARCLKLQGVSLLSQTEPEGYGPLRAAIARHVRIARGVRCEPGQIVITAGAQQAFALCCNVLLNRGDRIWFEEPGYSGALGAFSYAGIDADPVPVDECGIDVSRGIRSNRGAKLAYVTPTHQFPLGVPMTLERRLELLEWAKREDAWIMEDDYDSEFRFEGQSLPALYGLDDAGRVIYIGTFSKSVFPALRLGFAVLPPDLVAPFARARAFTDHHSPVHAQATLTEFIEGGHFALHVRKMRSLYRKRRDVILGSLRQHWGDAVEVPHSDTGLHITVLLPRGADDRRVSEAAAANGVMALPLSAFGQRQLERGGLVLGFAGVAESEIRRGVGLLGITDT